MIQRLLLRGRGRSVYSTKCMCKHMIPVMATVKKWCGKMCLAFLFGVSLNDYTGMTLTSITEMSYLFPYVFIYWLLLESQLEANDLINKQVAKWTTIAYMIASK